MIRRLAARMAARCQHYADACWYEYERAWTGLDMDDWERSYRHWTRRAAWWRRWS